jgi:hypothetical protein
MVSAVAVQMRGWLYQGRRLWADRVDDHIGQANAGRRDASADSSGGFYKPFALVFPELHTNEDLQPTVRVCDPGPLPQIAIDISEIRPVALAEIFIDGYKGCRGHESPRDEYRRSGFRGADSSYLSN